jgi:hypothetical protein
MLNLSEINVIMGARGVRERSPLQAMDLDGAFGPDFLTALMHLAVGLYLVRVGQRRSRRVSFERLATHPRLADRWLLPETRALKDGRRRHAEFW